MGCCFNGRFLGLFSSIVIAGVAYCSFASGISVAATPSSCMFSYINQEKIKSKIYSVNYKSDAKDKYTRAVVAKVLCSKFEEKLGEKIEEIVDKCSVYDVSRFKSCESLILRVDAGSDFSKKFLSRDFYKITSEEFDKALNEIISGLKLSLAEFSKFSNKISGKNFVLPDVFDSEVDIKICSNTYYDLVISPVLNRFFPKLKLRVSGDFKENLTDYSAEFLKYISDEACSLIKARIKGFEKLKNRVKKHFGVKYFSFKDYVLEDVRSDTPLDVSDFVTFLPSKKSFGLYKIDELLAVAACIFSLYKLKFSSYVKGDLKELADLSKYEIPGYYDGVVKVISDIVKNCNLSSKISRGYIEDLENIVDFGNNKVSFGILKNKSQLKLLNPAWPCSLYKILKTVKLGNKASIF